MVEEGSPWLFAGTGMGKIPPRGDGDGGLFPDGEFPVAILTRDASMQPRLLRLLGDAHAVQL